MKTYRLFLMIPLLWSCIGFAQDDLPTFTSREEIPEKYKWDLTPIYKDWKHWEQDVENIKSIYTQMASMEGTLGTNPQNLIDFVNLEEQAGKIGIKLFCYAYLFRSMDSRNPEANNRYQEINGVMSELSTKVSWVSPEMLSIPEEQMLKWVDENKELEPFRFGLTRMYRTQKYVLDTDTERILSYFSLPLSTAGNIYTELSTSDIKRQEVTLSDGRTLSMTPGNYSQVVTFSKNREDRKAAYEAFFQPYMDYENTYAAILNAVYQGDWASVKARGYNSYLQASLYYNDIPEEVYLNLIETAKTNTQPLRRYIDIRRKALGYDEYHPWDGSVSITEFEKVYSWDEASSLIIEAVEPLGKAYQDELKKCFAGGRIDVYETPGKEGGAYSMGVYGVHPYILMNYNGTMNHMFTLAHELGHNLHSIHSSQSQPHNSHRYSTFVAEVASIFNEHLLLDYMLKQSKDPNERIALLNQAIGNIVGTFYRQSLFADFELQVRTRAEEGQPINAPALNGIMAELNKTYNGDAVAHNEFASRTWAYVMHFFQLKYYVYQYATSYAASAHLFDQIVHGSKRERKAATEKYIELLRSGGSDFPINQLKKAGVDMTNPEVIKSVSRRLDQLVEQLEKELKAINKL
ncbi:oligoendopeptidase F [Perlabentimonas gracilis]|uniref:oligoendopeptidase F n=1 Tax=Perlabentimonas gracilis TaxID=2715279 RepID=UPI00140A1976|nr:oligoendopeptidase F [Perlabentimonas gracilis]NHB68709.1 oligoendopeptidase F [Perlabentimonas gracilis]